MPKLGWHLEIGTPTILYMACIYYVEVGWLIALQQKHNLLTMPSSQCIHTCILQIWTNQYEPICSVYLYMYMNMYMNMYIGYN